MLYFYLSLIESPEEKVKFEQLYLEYREYLLRIAQDILRNEYDAEDVLHQAFIRIAHNMGNIEEVTSHQTRNYLVIIVKGLSLNLSKKNRKADVVPFEGIYELEDDFVLEDDMLKQMRDESLQETLRKLPSAHRDILYLMYFADLPVKDIARGMDLSISATKKRLERARYALQALLKSEGIEER